MASINGVSIKGLKTFRGHEGEICSQGNVYLDGKKLGFWSENSWSGAGDYEFDEKLLKERCDMMAEGMKDGRVPIKEIMCADILLYHLTILMDYEKDFKKAVKRGTKAVVFTTNKHLISMYEFAYDDTDENLIKACSELYPYTSVFRTLDDFNITIDKEHPMSGVLGE